VSRRVKEGRRLTQHQITVAGLTVTVEALPWCDCTPAVMGFTKRSDGCWVKPCCMRRTHQMWVEYGDNPVPIGNRERSTS
jgi:hypothetical protein